MNESLLTNFWFWFKVILFPAVILLAFFMLEPQTGVGLIAQNGPALHQEQHP